MTDHLTTEITSAYAGTWYDLPDGTKRYYTEEHIAHMATLHARHEDTVQVADAIDTVRAKRNRAPVGIRVSTAAPPQRKPEEKPLRRCVVCGDPMIGPYHGKAKAHTWCRAEMQHGTERAQKEKQKAVREGRAA